MTDWLDTYLGVGACQAAARLSTPDERQAMYADLARQRAATLANFEAILDGQPLPDPVSGRPENMAIDHRGEADTTRMTDVRPSLIAPPSDSSAVAPGARSGLAPDATGEDKRTTHLTLERTTQMKLITLSPPPAPPPIAFFCPGCGAQVLYTRAELDATCAMPGQGVTPNARQCPTCHEMMRRVTRPVYLP